METLSNAAQELEGQKKKMMKKGVLPCPTRSLWNYRKVVANLRLTHA